MNSLSWLIYWVGAVDGLNCFALWLAIPATMGLMAVLVMWIVFNSVDVSAAASKGKHYSSEPIPDITWKGWAVGKNLALGVWLLGWIMFIFIPSQQTLLLIVGSEIGQKVVNSDAVHQVVDPGMELLKTWITTETAKLKPRATEAKK